MSFFFVVSIALASNTTIYNTRKIQMKMAIFSLRVFPKSPHKREDNARIYPHIINI